MESYVEVTWLTAFINLFFSTIVAFYISYKPLAIKKLLYYSGIVSTYTVFCFFAYDWLILLMIEWIAFYKIFYYAKKTWLIMIANRFLLNLTCYVFFQGSFHLGTYFVPSDVIPWIYWICILFLIVILYRKWNHSLSEMDFVYKSLLLVNDKELPIKGYLDSGNLLTYHNRPVVFVDSSLKEYFEPVSIQWIVMKDVSSERNIQCYPAQMKIGDGVWKQVFIHCSQQLQLPFACNALLNMKMMTQE